MVIAGRGGSSYIDTVVLRDRDTNGGGGWTGASDGTLEARHYYAQPPRWRADVSGIFDHTGAVLEWVKYSAYGVPHLLTPGDHDKSGEVDKDDETAFNADYGTGNLRADLDEDGDVDADDQTLFTASFNKTTPGGRWKLSAADVGNRKGYAGYEHEGFGNDLAATEIAHVRHRVLHFGLGRWTKRDPLGNTDGLNLMSYVQSEVIRQTDPSGLIAVPTGGGCGGSCGSGTRPGPGPGYLGLEPWECAARTPSGRDCYTCCNQGEFAPGSPELWQCYKWCNRQYYPGNMPPFDVAPQPDGPYFFTPANHIACMSFCFAPTNYIGCRGVITEKGMSYVCCLCEINLRIRFGNDAADLILECARKSVECQINAMRGEPRREPLLSCRMAGCVLDEQDCLTVARDKCFDTAADPEVCRSQIDWYIDSRLPEMNMIRDLCAFERYPP